MWSLCVYVCLCVCVYVCARMCVVYGTNHIKVYSYSHLARASTNFEDNSCVVLEYRSNACVAIRRLVNI